MTAPGSGPMLRRIGPAMPGFLDRSRRPLVALWMRTALLMTVVGAAAFVADSTAPRADLGKPTPAAEPAALKDDTRIGSQPQGAVPPAADPRRDAASTEALFGAQPIAPTRFTAGRHGASVAGTFAPPAGPASPQRETWTEREFSDMAALDGRTLQADGVRIRLIGLDLPMPEQVCRTLDGRFEPCLTRAATQLELLTRGRAVTCVYRTDASGEAVGRCRIGFSDLTERLIHTGYAWPAAATPTRSAL